VSELLVTRKQAGVKSILSPFVVAKVFAPLREFQQLLFYDLIDHLTPFWPPFFHRKDAQRVGRVHCMTRKNMSRSRLYGTIVPTAPITFTITINDPIAARISYLRYLNAPFEH
jgi:hypothetical protein